MRFATRHALIGLVLASASAQAQVPAPDPTGLQKQLAELEARIAALQREAALLREQLEKVAPAKLVILTPQEAVDAFHKQPDRPVTVEFGVLEGTGAIYSGRGPDPSTFLTAVWDNPLRGGGTFKAIIRSKAYAALTIPSKEKGKEPTKPALGNERDAVARHIDEHGVRVTGVVRRSPNPSFTDDYYIEVDDPSKVLLFISINPRPIRTR